MDAIQKVKFKTGMQTAFAKLWYGFNRHVKGVKADKNLAYCEDGLKEHTLDVMYPSRKVKGGLPCIVYLHGGGWTAYDKCLFRSSTKELAARGAVVFNCNHRLAPDYSFEDMEGDIAQIMAFIAKHAHEFGGNPEKIILAGDSSGAHLCALYANRLYKDGTEEAKKIIGCVFFYGVYDLIAMKDVPFNNKEAYISAAMPYNVPERVKLLRKFSPINCITAQLPPTLLFSGMIDPLYEGQTAAYMAALKAVGVRVDSLIFPPEDEDAEHRYITFSRNPAAKKSFAKFEKFLKTLVKNNNA